MSLKAVTGAGAKLKIGDGASPEVFTTVFENVSIGDIGAESALIDATHLLSVGKEYVYDLPDGAEFPIVVNYNADDATHAALLAAQAARTNRNMQWHLPVGASASPKMLTFAALIRGWKMPTETSAVLRNTYTLKISGGITGPVAAV